jgi:2-polyprenyl-3-methyl-5-hydroxy-6-metoxy-1,4-benzoquinol methylase
VRPDDPAVVREEYASEARLAVRKAAHALAGGPDAREALFEAVAEVAPRRILDVGYGEGELAERLARELDAEVVAIDQSIRMVQLARERGVDARLGDAQAFEFGGPAFDCVVAAWMLYHVRDLDRAAQAYIDSLVLLEGTRGPSAGGPIRARRTPAIFIAER